MQELRFVAVSEDGSYAVLAVPGRSGRFILPIDERLRAVAQGQTTRLAQYEIEVESPLRPKEIQARIRAGETAEEIADAAGIPVERVRWFEGPVLAERAYIADQAQAASVRRAGDSAGPGPRLGDIVPERLTASGADPEDGQWDSRKRGDGNWQVTLTFPSGGRLHVAEWVFDSRRRHVMPDDDNAARLSLPESELPPEPVSLPGEATVTPLAPRLGAAAGMGGGGMGGFGGGGSGVGVRSFRPERSVIPDRSLGADRSLADRPLPPVHAPAAAAASASGGDRPVIPERPAMSHNQAAPPVPPRPAHHDHTAFRDAAPEQVAHRDPAPEPTVYRAPAPEQRAPDQRAPEQPAPAGTVPVTAPPYVFEDLPSPAGHAPSRHVVFEDPEPAFHDEQLELAPAPAPGGTAPASTAPASTATPTSPAAPVSPAGSVNPATPAGTGASVAAPLPQPPAQPDERLRQPEAASAREFTPGTSAARQTPQPQPAAVTQQQPVTMAPTAPAAAAVTSSAQQPATSPAPAAEAPAVQPPAVQAPAVQAPAASAATPAPVQAPSPAEPAAPAAAGAQPEPAKPAAAGPAPAAAAKPDTAPAVESATRTPADPVSAPAAPVLTESPAASAAATPATATPATAAPAPVGRPEPAPAAASVAKPAPEPEPEPAAAPPAQAEPGEDQSARQRAGAKKSAKGRRSSVPSWDEIMLGSSRQRD
ncbi:MAG: septation protein SepH [Trebonia sp.]|jgi:hypothetical protein